MRGAGVEVVRAEGMDQAGLCMRPALAGTAVCPVTLAAAGLRQVTVHADEDTPASASSQARSSRQARKHRLAGLGVPDGLVRVPSATRIVILMRYASGSGVLPQARDVQALSRAQPRGALVSGGPG